MPIVFSCAGCEKQLRVPDGAGGKKTRCPACGEVATAPPEEPQFEVVEEPPPVARPTPLRNPRRDAEDDAPPPKLAEPDPPRRKKRKRRLRPSRIVHHDSRDSGTWFQTKRVMFCALGGLMLVGGVVALFTDDRPVRYLRAIGCVIVGGGLLVQGLTGKFDDQ